MQIDTSSGEHIIILGKPILVSLWFNIVNM